MVYIKATIDVEIICRVEGHEPFPQTPNNHLSGKGCKLCGIKRNVDKQRMTLEEFIKRAKEIHGDKYDYSKVKYVNMNTKVIITCPIHDDFPQTPHNHLQGHGCFECSNELIHNKQRFTIEEFIENSNEVHGEGKYDYSKVIYVNNHTDVIIICHNHDEPYEFPQTPNNHLSGEGCPLCDESQGEKKIRIFLTNNKIEFEREKRFEDCRCKRPLPFDFYLSNYNLCIEFDGKQHFNPSSFHSKNVTEEEKLKNFEYIQNNDNIKNNYCKNNNINLLRIRYDENVEEKLSEYFSKL